MRKRWTYLITAILLIVVILATLPSVRQQTIRGEIEEQYQRWTAAYRAHDVETLLDVLAPDYILKTSGDTVITLSDYEQSLRAKPKQESDNLYQNSMKEFHLKKDSAHVISVETSYEGDAPHEHEYLDIWKNYDGQWRLSRTETLHEH